MLKQILIFTVGFLLVFIAAAQPVNSAQSYYTYAKQLKGQGKFPEALQAFKKSAMLSKNYDSTYIEWSGLYITVGKPDSGLLVLKNAIALNPKTASLYTAMGNIYRDTKSNYDSALISYSDALKLDSTNKVSFYNVAWCFNAKKAYEKAIPFAIKALEIDNNYKPAFGELAHAYHALKNYAEALAQFQKYIGTSPSDLPLFYCGLIYMEMGQDDNMQKMIDELNKRGSKNLADGIKKRWDMKKAQKPTQ